MRTNRFLLRQLERNQGQTPREIGAVDRRRFQRIRGDMEQLIGVIQQKTGEARQAIEKYLQEISHNAASTARGYARHAAEQIHAGCDKAECVVRDRPGESMLVCFGAGLIAGVVIVLSLRSR